ncbi:NifB/NifX family molybdenum-iron cluster-binding protein [Vibrio sp. F74]|uniref:NifB/NifX family molybdenum-iron cluster-binding protein n=1 Tax=Vibrio sp. F74 TaxID=700020 RepID=UPI0035F58EF8
MIYAIPHSRECVANHFMKAKQFAFINADNSFIHDAINPAAGGNSSCSDKKDSITLIKKMKTDAVIVRNIGERALGKLLSSGIRVFQVAQQTPVASAISSSMIELTESTQGRPSKKHLQKGGCSGHSCGCSEHSNGCIDHHGTGHHGAGHHRAGLHNAEKRSAVNRGPGHGKAMFRQMNPISSLSPLDKR